ncbi:hypothetical protein F4802DRAFT_545936 [Xylaria palmicola]|nr:hypothetical protein F4802DRAFT_545936 [Xylaria palmicola]
MCKIQTWMACLFYWLCEDQGVITTLCVLRPISYHEHLSRKPTQKCLPIKLKGLFMTISILCLGNVRDCGVV